MILLIDILKEEILNYDCLLNIYEEVLDKGVNHFVL